MLQDLLVAAVNQAIEQSQAMAAERLEGLTGGLNLPGF
jgi:DNA-binding protein YbaB